jgi:hypothetical protein
MASGTPRQAPLMLITLNLSQSGFQKDQKLDWPQLTARKQLLQLCQAGSVFCSSQYFCSLAKCRFKGLSERAATGLARLTLLATSSGFRTGSARRSADSSLLASFSCLFLLARFGAGG